VSYHSTGNINEEYLKIFFIFSIIQGVTLPLLSGMPMKIHASFVTASICDYKENGK
jgi:hypothetical protein